MPDIRLTAVAALAAASAVAIPSLAAPDTADAYAFGQRALAQGSSGSDVRELQVLLRRTGVRIVVDGAFGPATASALRRFERTADLTADARLTRAEAPTLREQAAAAVAARRAERSAAAVETGARQTETTDDSPFVGGATPDQPIEEPDTASGTADEGVFPIRGKHDLGQSETNDFGGGRGHQGQDMFARCGTTVVAARSGKVAAAKYHGAAGNYVVITDRSGQSTAYMHLRAPSSVSTGDRVGAGQPIGEVGDTGRASGCHLHFELWTAPGWYQGGKPIDPLPTLRAWDRAGAGARSGA